MLSPENFWNSQPPRSVLRPYRTAVYVDYTAKSRRYGEHGTGLVILWIYMAILRRSISRPFSARFGIDNDGISADNSHAYLHWWGTASI